MHPLDTRKSAMNSNKNRIPLGIMISGGAMILFGLAEIVTGFTHTFMGITTSTATLFTWSGAAIGACYAIAGAGILTMKRWAAILAIVLLIVDILARVALTISGLYPTDSFRNTLAIILGTAIAAFFAFYIGFRLKSFR